MEQLDAAAAEQTNHWSWLAKAAGSVAIGAALIGADRLAGRWDERHESVEPYYTLYDNETSDHTVVIAPGCQTNGQTVSAMLAPHLQPHANVIGLGYPGRGFDIDDLREGLYEHLAERGSSRLSFLGMSMGGMVVAHTLDHMRRHGLEGRYGHVENVVMDDAPDTTASLTRASRNLLSLNHALGNSLGAFWAKPHIKYLRGQTNYEPDVDAELAYRRIDERVGARPSAIAGQGRFMASFNLPAGSLEGVAERVVMIQSSHDPTVVTERAHQGWQAIYGQVEAVSDPNRPAGEHASSPEFPTLPASLLTSDVLAAA